MRRLIISSLAVLLAVSVYADESKEPEVATSDEASSSDIAGSFYKDFDCSSCGGKTKK